MRIEPYINGTRPERPWLPLSQPVEVPQRLLLRRIGCPETVRPGTRTVRDLHHAAAAVAEHARPSAAWRSYPLRVERGRAFVDNRIALRSAKLAHMLDPCSELYVFVVTLGSAMDTLIEKAQRRRYRFGMLLDAAASVGAECQADRLMDAFRRTLMPGTGLTLRHSPGYCDWPLREQEKLYALLPKHPAGTELSADCLMSPRKSVSGIVGVGPSDTVHQLGCTCHCCTRSDCENRRS